ncbi:sodium:proton antiporter [Neisseria sp. Ec49-e6-T10]|uniref:sodium:proton antiporter n=1 Tax=Neisseria sp. Ec49-e6-T10 TaxID=3140744 RepID=UPI003EC09ED2
MRLFVLSFLLLVPTFSHAADFDAQSLSMLWAIPFVGILLSIALFPLFAPHFWEHHYGKVTLIWGLLFIIPFYVTFGSYMTGMVLAHALIEEYIPFILLLGALFTISGSIHIAGDFHATPKFNTGILAIGTLLASVMGTSGAAMLLIRPLLKANQHRDVKAHVVVFFIFLVANVGGGLTPLGDPPLFLGFLKGVSFAWTFEHMLVPVLITSVILLIIFYIFDSIVFKKDLFDAEHIKKDNMSFSIQGKVNFILLAGVIGSILLSGVWKPNIQWEILGAHIKLENLTRDLLLLTLIILSLVLIPKKIRENNHFNWHPILEVGKLFLGIFITIFPVIAMLKVGQEGHFGSLIALMHDQTGEPINLMYFWITGILSGVLDNAPTYLVFFNLAGGEAQELMGPLYHTLLAISMGSVFLGALTYIGNAPNFMVKAIAEQSGVKMPSFFGYMAYSIVFLLPVYAFVSWLVLVVF